MPDKTLVDKEIVAAVQSKRLEIDNFDQNSVQPASYDMHAGEVYAVNEKNKWEAYGLKQNGGIVIETFQSVMFSSHEVIRMPQNMLGRISLKQRWANQGIDYNSGSIDPTFQGRLWIMLRNVGLGPIRVNYLDPLVSVEWTLLDQPTQNVFSSKAFLNLDDLPPDKRPVAPTTRFHTSEEIYKAVENLEDIQQRLNFFTYLMIPVVIGVLGTLIVIAYEIFLKGLR